MRTTTNSSGFLQVFYQPVDVDGGNWSRTSTTTPGFGKVLMEGAKQDLPMNPFNYNHVKKVGQSGHTVATVTNLTTGAWSKTEWRGLFECCTMANPAKNSSIFIDLNLRASRKLLSRIKNQDFSAPVAVAEGRKTIRMIADIVTQVARAGLALRRGNFRGAADALGVSPRGGALKRSRYQSLANNWLELQYGWQPLLSDVYGLAQYLEKSKAYKKREVITSVVHRQVHETALYKGDTAWTTEVKESTYTVKYVVYFSEDDVVQTSTALGLGNPAAVAWELVPFSFVVDWFLPIGSFLENLDATVGRVFVKGCVTEFYRGRHTAFATGAPSKVVNGQRYDNNIKTEDMVETIWCSRVPLTAFPAPQFPIYQNPLSVHHAATAFALLAQVFSGAPVKHLRI